MVIVQWVENDHCISFLDTKLLVINKPVWNKVRFSLMKPENSVLILHRYKQFKNSKC